MRAQKIREKIKLINMTKSLNIKTLVLSAILLAGMLLPFASNAQGTDLFFRIDNDDIYNNRDEEGITIEGQNGGGMSHENPLPLGSGLLILTAAGAGYAVARRKRMLKNGTALLLAFALLIGMTQCKKKIVTATDSDKIYVTLDASYGGSRTVFVPGDANGGTGFLWNDGDEYIYVGGSVDGYLGRLHKAAEGGNAQTTRIVFEGELTTPSGTQDYYFFYLGNAPRTIAANAVKETIDFSNQENKEESNVTDCLIAIDRGTLTQISGNNYKATADLKVKTAIAYFVLSGYENNNVDETVYLHGANVFSSAEIDFKNGTVTGVDNGWINVGTNGNKYVSLIANDGSATTLKFESNTHTGEMTFPNGIQEKVFYSDESNQEYTPLPVTVSSSLPEDVLPGLFSVTPDKKVRFSKGNLQYSRADLNTPWGEGEWSFMEPQYSTVEVEENVGINYGNKTKIGLFGWGCTGDKDTQYGEGQVYFKPNYTKADSAVYYQDDEGKWHVITYTYSDKYGPYGSGLSLSVANHSDWGWCIGGEQSKWRTLSSHEWTWLLGCEDSDSGLPNGTSATPGTTCRRSSTVCGKANARFLRARINVSKAYVTGLIIFPDDYTQPDGIALTTDYINYQTPSDGSWSHYNTLSEENWAAMEAAGAVFLPGASFRMSTNVYVGYNSPANYWSSTSIGTTDARGLNIYGERLLIYSPGRCNGYSVRLVYDAE